MQVILYLNGSAKFHYIHRLVAKAFIPNSKNKTQVNHIDENKQNNNVLNLEWCTSKYNVNYGDRNNKISISKGKKVNQYDLKGNFIKSYQSTRFAEKNCNIAHQIISECCNGKIKEAGGFVWKYI